MKHIVAVALLASCIVSCSPSSTEPGTQTYIDAKLAFRFDYPETWKKAGVGGTGVVLFTGGDARRLRQISVSHETGGEKEIGEYIKQYRTAMPSYREVQGEWISLHDRRAYLQTILWNSPTGDNKGIRLFMPVNGHFFVVSAVCSLSNFGNDAELLRKCILSFQVTAK